MIHEKYDETHKFKFIFFCNSNFRFSITIMNNVT